MYCETNPKQLQQAGPVIAGSPPPERGWKPGQVIQSSVENKARFAGRAGVSLLQLMSTGKNGTSCIWDLPQVLQQLLCNMH